MAQSWTSEERFIVEHNMNRGIIVVNDKLAERGFLRTPEAIGRMMRRIKFNQKMSKNLRIGYLDIESTGLNADWGKLLTWCVKAKGGKIYFDTIKKKDILSFKDDQRILRSLVKCMEDNFDHIVTWNGGFTKYGFDLKMILSRCVKYDIPFPLYGSLTETDLLIVARRRLKLASYRLEAVADHLGIKGKTPIDKECWRKGAIGHTESIMEILRHNKGDVVVLEEVDKRLKNYHDNQRKVF